MFLLYWHSVEKYLLDHKAEAPSLDVMLLPSEQTSHWSSSPRTADSW